MDNKVYCSECVHFCSDIFCFGDASHPYNRCLAPLHVMGNIKKEEDAIFPERIENVYEEDLSCQEKNKYNNCISFTRRHYD